MLQELMGSLLLQEYRLRAFCMDFSIATGGRDTQTDSSKILQSGKPLKDEVQVYESAVSTEEGGEIQT